MEANKILSANILDLVFDNRNKEYGAYELRVTYPKRIKRAMLLVFIIAALAITGAALASSMKPSRDSRIVYNETTLQTLPDEKIPEPIPEPIKKPETPPQRTEQYTPPVITDDRDVKEPPPTQTDLDDSRIDVMKQDGAIDDGTVKEPEVIDKGTGIIEPKKGEPEGPFRVVEIDAKFTGNWEKFLIKNLDGTVAVDKGAPAGVYKVIMQFVVDIDGSVSDIKALTAHGYGMEEEATRVLRKATKWEPAIQNGHQVKAYRIQPITFKVDDGSN